MGLNNAARSRALSKLSGKCPPKDLLGQFAGGVGLSAGDGEGECGHTDTVAIIQASRDCMKDPVVCQVISPVRLNC